MKYWLYGLVLLLSASAQAIELKVQQVTKQVYALVGEIGPRTPQNHALNNTLGFVLTRDGVVLVSSGATPLAAKLVEKTIAEVSTLPIILVINIGVQDHHWMGNSYFAAKNIPIKALQRTVDSQREQIPNHLNRLRTQIGEEASQVNPVFASDIIRADQRAFRIGDTNFELLWPGDGHFKGDAVLWLPASKVVFTGDHVYQDRLLGIHPTTPVVKWQQSFHEIAKLKPQHVVPGHGYPGDFSRAVAETGSYLDWIVPAVRNALADWKELDETIELLANKPAFEQLKYYDSWHKRNIHQVYMQLEAAQ